MRNRLSYTYPFLQTTITGLLFVAGLFATASAQYLLGVDSTYKGIMDQVHADPDLKVLFEDTNKKFVLSHFRWTGSYYFTEGKLYRTEISTTLSTPKEAQVELEHYAAYLDSVYSPQHKEYKDTRRMKQHIMVNREYTIVARMEIIKSNKVLLIVAVTRCAIAPKNDVEEGECNPLPR